MLEDVKKQTQMAMLSKERDRLLMAVRSYKSLFDTTNQLIAELRSALIALLVEFQVRFDSVARHQCTVLALVVAAGIAELSSSEWCTSPRQSVCG